MSCSPYYLKEIKDREGRILYEAPQAQAQQLMEKTHALTLTHMLNEVIRSGTGRRLIDHYQLNPQSLAGKTGTTQNHSDGWFIGYHPELVVGVRVGANHPQIHFQSTALGQGANTALPIFGLFMQKCVNSPSFAHWDNLRLPSPPEELNEALHTPIYKENLPLWERLTQPKKEKESLWKRISRFMKRKS